MVLDVLIFATEYASLPAALRLRGKSCESTDFGNDPQGALNSAAGEINSGDVRLVLCTVSPPEPLAVLDLLTAVKDVTSSCKFYFAAQDQATIDTHMSADDQQQALDMGARSEFLIGNSNDDLADHIVDILDGTVTGSNSMLLAEAPPKSANDSTTTTTKTTAPKETLAQENPAEQSSAKKSRTKTKSASRKSSNKKAADRNDARLK